MIYGDTGIIMNSSVRSIFSACFAMTVCLAVNLCRANDQVPKEVRETRESQRVSRRDAIISAWYLYQMGAIYPIVDKKPSSTKSDDPFPVEIDKNYTFNKSTTTEHDVIGIQKSALEKYCKGGKKAPADWVKEQKKALALLILTKKHDLGKTDIKDIPDLMNIVNNQAGSIDLDRIIGMKIDANQLTDLMRLLDEQANILKSLNSTYSTNPIKD